MKVKASDKLTFPLRIDMEAYLSPVNASGVPGRQVYDLQAILIHKGSSASQGHYGKSASTIAPLLLCSSSVQACFGCTEQTHSKPGLSRNSVKHGQSISGKLYCTWHSWILARLLWYSSLRHAMACFMAQLTCVGYMALVQCCLHCSGTCA